MKRLLAALVLATLPAFGQDPMAAQPCRMDGTDCPGTYAGTPAPSGAAANDIAVFLGSPLRLSYLTAGTALQVLRVNAAGNALEWAAASGVSGLTAGRVALSTGATSVGDDAGLTYDAATDTLTVGSVFNVGTGGKLTSPAAATLQLGAAASATPVAQTLQAQGSRGGTDTNIAGADLTIGSGIGTGSATGSKINLRVPFAGGSGTGAQSTFNALVLDSANATFSVAANTGTVYPGVTDLSTLGQSSYLYRTLYLSRATLGSKSKTLTDNVATAFATIPMADGVSTGGKLIYRCIVTSGTARQVVSGSINYAAVRDGASYVVDYDEVQQSTAVTSGTLTGSVTAAGASSLLTFSAQFDTSLGTPTITFYYRFDSTDVLAVTSL